MYKEESQFQATSNRKALNILLERIHVRCSTLLLNNDIPFPHSILTIHNPPHHIRNPSDANLQLRLFLPRKAQPDMPVKLHDSVTGDFEDRPRGDNHAFVSTSRSQQSGAQVRW